MRSRIWILGDDVNTDIIFPGKYTYTISDPSEMARHAMEDLEPNFAKEVREGDIIVAGKNFGCGSSRDQAAFALKYAGIAAIIARSFARIFFRNAINAGLPAIELSQAVDAVRPDSEVVVDIMRGAVCVDGVDFSFEPFPKQVIAILKKGGLAQCVREAL